MSGDPVASADQRLSGLRPRWRLPRIRKQPGTPTRKRLKAGWAGLMLAHRQSMMGSAGVAPEQRFAFHQQGLEQMQRITTTGRDLYNLLTPGSRLDSPI